MMGYLFLALAIGFEVTGTTAMKLSEGFTKPWWTLVLVLSYGVSLGLLTLSLRSLSVGTAYAIWSGVGTAMVALLGWLVFREVLTVGQLVCLGFIIVGVVGLNLFGNLH